MEEEEGGGGLLITIEEELNKAIRDYKRGKLRQMIDIDPKLASLTTTLNLWTLLCRELLTGLLRPDSPLPEMALRASALMDEKLALQAHIADAQNVLSEHKSCFESIREKLNRSSWSPPCSL